MPSLTVHRLRARKDNYVWLLVDEASREAVVVDPSEAAPVVAKLDELGLPLSAIWCTHHHRTITWAAMPSPGALAAGPRLRLGL